MTIPLISRGNGRWGSPSPAWDHLINRESSGIPDIIQSPNVVDVNTGGNEAEGLFQITPKTWKGAGGLDFAPSARRATPQQQAVVAARIFTRNPSGSDWGAGRPGREDPRELAAGLVPLDSNQVQETPVDPNRPDFNEFPIWSTNNSGRNTKVDCFLLHTQEGGGGDAAAENLAKWFQNANGVSYHYTISQAADGGVTVVDCVDTDYASWSVLSANGRSINLCFAGSRASWTREQWLKQAKAIDVAAYLAVQDAKKYGFTPKVVPPPYTDRIPGISDHRYVTKVLGDGTHTDVGDQFPWDVFAAAVKKYTEGAPSAPEEPTKPTPVGPADDQLTLRWNCLGGQTLVEAVAQIRDRLLGTEDRAKTGVKP
ncbi:transglycosylase family protein [Micrococcus luteus]|uniref:transglycosylase family protein n=1 Tax=Micrococcus luteus TaxID=1270 RepID=UPI00343148EB